MSHETPIGNLSGGISDEDSRLVDSILNDINSSPSPGLPQQEQPSRREPEQQQQLSPEQVKMLQQQQHLRQQQMAHQQQMAQQSQQQASVQQQMNMIKQGSSGDIIESVKLEAKNIMTIVFLCIIFNIEQVDNLLKGVTMFVAEGGQLNMQAVFLKSILIGLIFYLVKTYLL